VIAEAICAGLLARDGSMGGAVRLETSMLHATMDIQHSALSLERPVPDGIFQTANGHIAVTCRDDADWARLAGLLGSSELSAAELTAAHGRRARRAYVDRELGRIFALAPAAAWTHALGRAGIPCVRASHDEEVIARRDLWAWGVLRELPIDGAEPLVCGGPPWPFADVPATLASVTPGQHTNALHARGERFWSLA
jgi:crotonobetainyl-CoA:carnitine CoA-transferase CaiB-like acyl-CoA transferase